MPTYQYRCKQCGQEFEKVQSFSDDSTPKCPNCGTRSKKNISKIFSAVGISFKGGGFYKNDHGTKGAPASKSSGSSSSGESSSSDSSSSDSSSTSSGSSDSSSSTTSSSTTSSSTSSSNTSSSDSSAKKKSSD